VRVIAAVLSLCLFRAFHGVLGSISEALVPLTPLAEGLSPEPFAQGWVVVLALAGTVSMLGCLHLVLDEVVTSQLDKARYWAAAAIGGAVAL
jgi:hypothetical protein